MLQTPNKRLGKIPQTQKDDGDNCTRWYKGFKPSTLDSHISAKDFTSIYLKGEELQSIPYNYFDSYTSRPSLPLPYFSLCPYLAIVSPNLFNAPLYIPIAIDTPLALQLVTPLPSNKKQTKKTRSTQQLSTQELSTQELSTQELSTQELSTQELSTQELSIQQLSTQQLSTQQLSTQQLSTQELVPSNQYPGTKYPGTKYSGTKYPATKYPGTKYPGTKYPATKYPATKYPATKYPATKYPGTSTQELVPRN